MSKNKKHKGTPEANYLLIQSLTLHRNLITYYQLHIKNYSLCVNQYHLSILFFLSNSTASKIIKENGSTLLLKVDATIYYDYGQDQGTKHNIKISYYWCSFNVKDQKSI